MSKRDVIFINRIGELLSSINIIIQTEFPDGRFESIDTEIEDLFNSLDAHLQESFLIVSELQIKLINNKE